ncbi:hypothetical protein [Persicirhabdus sediminis]|uniref:Uncharacterized protein n=1 Tax=Persicirhabdus sediminis TaxID=454144 RepID=A0A8J7MJC8_9BACT|nr:hypothetical protein [Persicirhabdus sediminis]MBK1792073.1 hypothetical protein [Persicirhabdus sediminis]
MKISKRKLRYPISPSLYQYLTHYRRYIDIPIVYDDMLRFTGAMPYENPDGEETLWLTVMYPHEVREEIYPKLKRIYAELKIGGDMIMSDHLVIDRVDYGEFGNSRPFRVRITNKFNDNSDYFYVKAVDASRIYGLELEHILSPNKIHYILKANTLIESHIAGVPGNVFIKEYLPRENTNRVRIAKEFVKFNERCFLRLLGDMRSVNYVIDITPDFEEIQYRVRPIDFDQQSYEGNSHVYMAYRCLTNRDVAKLSFTELNRPSISQYAREERMQTINRAATESQRLTALMKIMARDELSPPAKLKSLSEQLNEIHHTDVFTNCTSMGDLTRIHIDKVLQQT